jgi:ketosteroid isomerase-like protein
MIRRSVAGLLLLGCALAGEAQTPVPPALATMAQEERDFAAACRKVGLRDSFLQFFADDALLFTPDPVNAKERLSKRPARPFSEVQLTWEPRLGDVASSGELGWLTGPSSLLVPNTPEPGPHAQNYLSVWRRQPSGEWRVIIDVGVGTPSAPPFEPGFHRVAMPDRYAGGGGRQAGTASLDAADRALNDRAAKSMADGYGPALSASSRFHREGILPLVGQTAIVAWLRARPVRFSGSTQKAESAEGGDFGYTYGAYRLEGGDAPESGSYIRVWQRRADGNWFVVADVTQPQPPR